MFWFNVDKPKWLERLFHDVMFCFIFHIKFVNRAMEMPGRRVISIRNVLHRSSNG
jgi:hypothetical protein